MKKPTSVKIAGHDYKIKWMDVEWGHEMERQGDCSAGSLLIRVVDDLRASETLWHEIGHGIYYEYAVGQVEGEEAINSLYMMGIYQVLCDNPEIRDMCLKNNLSKPEKV